jgi:putative nucleotidyltransferase with HDIG domain
VSSPAGFLTAFAHALAAMTLYADGHPARERAIDAAFQALTELQAAERRPLFTFLGDEIVYGQLPLRELRAWDWTPRLAQAGIQRLEFAEPVTRDDFGEFLDEVLARLTLSAIDTAEARQLRRSSIRFGSVGVKGETEQPATPVATTVMTYSLAEEAEAVRWCQDEVRSRGVVPLTEAEAVVRSLAIAMHGGHHIMIPLLQLKEFDQYTTTHSLNVAVLAMALAEYTGLAPRDVRAFGIAGLLHDIGKVRIPLEVLTKRGHFSDEETALMRRHPADGARIILDSREQLDLPAVVAYEHHIMLNGGGYPPLQIRRDCHRASRLVHVCDVFDALRTDRPYRDAWSQEQVLSYLATRGGTEFDAELVAAFVQMMRQWEPQLAVMHDERSAVIPGEDPPAAPATPPESAPDRA